MGHIENPGMVRTIYPDIFKHREIQKYSDMFRHIDGYIYFFHLGFLSQTFMTHRTAGKGPGYLFNSSLPLPPTSQTLRH